MSAKKITIHSYSTFSHWWSVGVLGVVCFQDISTRLFIFLGLLCIKTGSAALAHLSDKTGQKKKIILIAQSLVIVSCLLAYFGTVKNNHGIPIPVLVLSLVLNGFFGNAAPVLADHMTDCGFDHEKTVVRMLVFRLVGIACGILIGIVALKHTLFVSIIINCFSLLLLYKLFDIRAPALK